METEQDIKPENEGGEIAGFHDEIRGIQLEGYELGVKKQGTLYFGRRALLPFGKL